MKVVNSITLEKRTYHYKIEPKESVRTQNFRSIFTSILKAIDQSDGFYRLQWIRGLRMSFF